MIKKQNFELQLVVIGILITVYWQLLPELIRPITISGYNLTWTLFNLGCLMSGLIWFATLLIGTFSLAFKKENIEKMFDNMFKVSNIVTLWVLCTVAFIYSIFLIATIL